MNIVLSKLYNLFLPKKLSDRKRKEIYNFLEKEFEIYKTSNLKGITPEEFTKSIQSKIDIIDAKMEGYSDDELEQQRDLSIKFHWGHNHNFGNFKLYGRMDDRHINLLTNFITLFPISIDDFRNKNIFDIGCWTGGTTLLLAIFANKIFAIEEVKKYAETVSFLSKSFGINDRVTSKSLSIYDCNSEEFYNQFDIVYFPGVIYHLSDPVLSLRIIFNSLKIGGFILIESAGLNIDKPFCVFCGSNFFTPEERTKKEMNRGGWAWFTPSPSALYMMMQEAGFEEIKIQWYEKGKRIYGYGKKVSQRGICKAGLSVPNIK